ncbi:MAG: ATP-dependent DNA helicase RecG [Clostridia bacterium]|nr:ATP-dependent DNA helicase RecG [Clostridia bacterium]
MVDLKENIQFIKGVGPARVKLLNKLNIFTLEDIITYFPRDYEDRGIYKKINELNVGDIACFKAVAISKPTVARIKKNMTITKVIVRDETGSALLTWFNQDYVKNQIYGAEEYTFYGKVQKKIGDRVEISAPIFDKEGENKNTGKIIPLYPLTNGMTQNVIRGIIENALKLCDNSFEDFLPDWILKEYDICNLSFAINNIHFPEESKDFLKARKRVAFQELLILQLGLLNLKERGKIEDIGISFDKNENIEEFLNTLPFKLTNAQMRAWNEIKKDMESNKAMNRLVQGDVGSGKTIVACMAMYKAVKNGYQASMMAPTAILATQHYENISKLLEPFGIKCALFTSALTKKQKEQLLQQLKNGEIDIAIGTHALIEENIEFKNVGLVITDEQHRFGVRQRSKLSSKGEKVDTLVMTATPIPRTLALILYGDLDISIIDELPPGRQKIDTYAVKKNMENRINDFIRKEIKSGRQAYIVCPLVEESDLSDLKSVEAMFEHYKNVFPDLKVEFLHGKMKNKEKDEIMSTFKDGKIDILISTTVIEVGVDVPNATLMIVENAERFGLAQLHQLRGRVGRGKYKSYCILKYDSNSDIVKQRMNIMQETNDGFVISEEDLKLRGPGDFFGTMQHGVPEFKVANLFTDMDILKEAQECSKKLLANDPLLKMPENAGIKAKIADLFSEKLEL